jgi:hypothetical protein
MVEAWLRGLAVGSRPGSCLFGACECRRKHLRTRPDGNRSFESGNTRVVSFVEDREPCIAGSRFAGFASERWRTKERYRELERPVGDEQRLFGSYGADTVTIPIWSRL